MTDAELTLDALERMGGKQVTFYVGPFGNDDNSGRNIGKPMKSWQEAYKLCLPGDRIVVGVGVTDYTISYPVEWLDNLD